MGEHRLYLPQTPPVPLTPPARRYTHPYINTPIHQKRRRLLRLTLLAPPVVAHIHTISKTSSSHVVAPERQEEEVAVAAPLLPPQVQLLLVDHLAHVLRHQRAGLYGVVGGLWAGGRGGGVACVFVWTMDVERGGRVCVF